VCRTRQLAASAKPPKSGSLGPARRRWQDSPSLPVPTGSGLAPIVIGGPHQRSVARADCRPTDTLRNSTAYVRGWAKATRKDKRLIILTASQSQKATDYNVGLGVEEPAKDDSEWGATLDFWIVVVQSFGDDEGMASPKTNDTLVVETYAFSTVITSS
jgi:hypothetical protein